METVTAILALIPLVIKLGIVVVTTAGSIVGYLKARNATKATADAYTLLDVLIVTIDKMPEGDLKEKAKQHIAMLNKIAGTEAQVHEAVKAIEALLKANGLWGNEADQEMTRRSLDLVTTLKRKGAKRL